MKYRVKVAGKIFEGTDFRILIRRAVEAKRVARLRDLGTNGPNVLLRTGTGGRRVPRTV